MIYHKFSHGAAFYTLSGKNVNVMLEFQINRARVLNIIVVCSLLNASLLQMEMKAGSKAV